MRNEIIKMAREAGFRVGPSRDGPDDVWGVGANLERFYNLAVQHEREEFAKHAVDIARRAVAEEREECAKVCEESWQGSPKEIARQIRARGEKQ